MPRSDCVTALLILAPISPARLGSGFDVRMAVELIAARTDDRKFRLEEDVDKEECGDDDDDALYSL